MRGPGTAGPKMGGLGTRDGPDPVVRAEWERRKRLNRWLKLVPHEFTRKAEHAAAERAWHEQEMAVVETPATTPAGVVCKLALAMETLELFDDPGPGRAVQREIARLAALAAGADAAEPRAALRAALAAVRAIHAGLPESWQDSLSGWALERAGDDLERLAAGHSPARPAGVGWPELGRRVAVAASGAARYHPAMRFGPRIPSFRQRIAARTSWKRYARHSLGLKAPRGWGWVTNPKRAVYNRIYNRTTFPVVPSGRRSGGLAWFIVAGVLFVLAKMFGF